MSHSFLPTRWNRTVTRCCACTTLRGTWVIIVTANHSAYNVLSMYTQDAASVHFIDSPCPGQHGPASQPASSLSYAHEQMSGCISQIWFSFWGRRIEFSQANSSMRQTTPGICPGASASQHRCHPEGLYLAMRLQSLQASPCECKRFPFFFLICFM